MLKRLASANTEGTHWVLPIKPRRENSRVSRERKRKMEEIVEFSSPTYRKGGNTLLNRLISANGEGGYWTNLSVRGRKRSKLGSQIPTLPRTPRKKNPSRSRIVTPAASTTFSPSRIVTPASSTTFSPDNWTPEAKKGPDSRIIQVVEAAPVSNLIFGEEEKLVEKPVEKSVEKPTKKPSVERFPEFLTFMANLFRHRDSCTVKSVVDAFVMSQQASKSEIDSMLSRLQNMNRCMVHNGVVYAV